MTSSSSSSTCSSSLSLAAPSVQSACADIECSPIVHVAALASSTSTAGLVEHGEGAHGEASDAPQPHVRPGQHANADAAALLESGPAHFAAVRARWTQGHVPYDPLSDALTSSWRKRFPTISTDYLPQVYDGLLAGRRLARPLPLDLIVSALIAGWKVDGTWYGAGSAPGTDVPRDGHVIVGTTSVAHASKGARTQGKNTVETAFPDN